MSLQPHLWNVVAAAAGDEGRFRELLKSATQEQMIVLRKRFEEAAARLRAVTPTEHLPDPDRYASWIVASGRKAYDEALTSRVVAELPERVADFRGAFERVYRERFGGVMPHEEPEDVRLRYDPSWEKELWELIEVVNVGVPLEEAASNYTRSELILLDIAARVVVDRIETEVSNKTGRAIASTWIDIGDWLIGKGRDVVAHFIEHPDELPAEVPEGDSVFVGALENLYIDRYGVSMPDIQTTSE